MFAFWGRGHKEAIRQKTSRALLNIGYLMQFSRPRRVSGLAHERYVELGPNHCSINDTS